MNTTACPDAFQSYYTPACANTDPSAATQAITSAPQLVTWHLAPLSPSATGLVLVLLTILFATLLVSKAEK